MAFLIFIFLLTFVQAQSATLLTSSPIFGPRQVTGLLGGSVTVKCFYPHTSVNRHSRKYWCKESTRQCLTIVSTNGFVATKYRGRASITDFPESGIFIIEISELERSDIGTYKCGVGLSASGQSFRVQLDVSEDSAVPDGAQLFYIEQHGSVTMTCDFGEQYATSRKYLCKMSKTSCSTIIDTYGNIDLLYKGRVLLSNLQMPGSFSIIMTQLRKGDSGLYLCGTGNYGAGGESKQLDLHVYQEALVPKGQLVLNGVRGGSVTVECRYDPKENDTVKYWCKWRTHGCTQLIDNFGDVLDSYEGRIVMHDDPENGRYTIILNQLNAEDAGHYWCMTNGKDERKSTIELKIVEGQPSLATENEIHAVASSPLTISCSYPCKYAGYEKYWCKWNNIGCEPLISSEQNETGLVISCNEANRVLSLNFDQVAPTDQGWYWCGVRRAGHYEDTSAVYLQVQGVLITSNEDASPGKNPSDVIMPRINSEDGNSPLNKAKEESGAASLGDSPEESKKNTVLLSTLIPLGVVFLLLVTVGIVKLRLFKHSDLVSVGSYRTNISMTDFENTRQYGAKDNVCMEACETQIGSVDDYITSGSPKESGKSKKAKRGSKEEVEMAYTTVLLNSDNVIPTKSSQEQ